MRRADGTTQVVEIRRPLGAGRDGVYLALCGDAAPVTRVLLRHAPGEPRYNTRVRLLGRARAPSEGAVPLPCGAQPEARAEPESLPGYAWGATFAEVRARCIADGGTPTPLERDPRHLVCAPFAPLAALEARFYFGIGAARPGLREVQVVRSLHTTGEPMRDALRDELRTQVTTRGRPRSLPYPVHCDVVFFDAPWTCFGSGSYRARYEWGEGSFRVETEWMSARSAHELRFVYRRL